MKLIFVALFACLTGLACDTPKGVSEEKTRASTYSFRPPGFLSVRYYHQSHCWVLLDDGRLMHTSDGGTSWKDLNGNRLGKVTAFTFTSEVSGWALNKDLEVLRTRDGGENWSHISSLPQVSYSEGYRQLEFLDNANGSIMGSFTFWHTVDGGSVWNLSRLPDVKPDTSLWLSDFAFSRENVGWLTSSEGLLKTSNGGFSWQITPSFEEEGGNNYTREITWLNDRLGWVVYDRLYKTEDGGDTWQDIEPSEELLFRLESYTFVSERRGWSVGEDLMESISRRDRDDRVKTYILDTNDGGTTWKKRPLIVDGHLMKVKFLDEQHGWILTSRYIYRSNDGGSTWQEALRF